MFDLEEYEILISGFIETVTENSQYRPRTIVSYKVILDDYFHNNVINRVKKNDFSEIFSKERLVKLKRKSNIVRPSFLSFLSFLHQEEFIQEIEHYHLQNNVKSVFITEEVERSERLEFLTPNEMRSLFANRLVFKYDYEEKMVPLICSLSCFYMFKQEDVLKLKISDVDLDRKRMKNVRFTKENVELVEWLFLNDITIEYLKSYLDYRQALGYSGDHLLVMDNTPLDNRMINRLFSCFDRLDNKVLFGHKKISQTLLTRSMMLYILLSTRGEGLYRILLEQEMNTALQQAFEEYMSINRAENENKFYDRYTIDEILPKRNSKKDGGLYSEENDINLNDIGDYDLNNKRNLESDKVTIQRMVRDSKISRKLREMYNNECQLCGYRLRKATGEFYSEAHHIQPYNKLHRGDDNIHNLIVLCPNCHTQFDDLYYAIHPETREVHCVFEEEDQYHLEKLSMREGHALNSKYLDFTWELFEKKHNTITKTNKLE